MMKKKLFAGLLSSAALCVLMSSLAYAATPVRPENQEANRVRSVVVATPRYSYTEDVSVTLSFDGYSATCGLAVSGNSNATKNTGTLSLQKKSSSGSYSTVKSWSINESSGDIMLQKKYTVSSTGEYRLAYSGKVYAGSSYENISINANGTCD